MPLYILTSSRSRLDEEMTLVLFLCIFECVYRTEATSEKLFLNLGSIII